MAARGAEVTVIHLMGHLMERQLDPAAGYLCRRTWNAGASASTARARPRRSLARITSKPCCSKTARSIRPTSSAWRWHPAEVRLANDAHLEVGRGITVDDQMRTSDPAIFALGECVEHDKQLFGLVAPLYDQAKVLAATLLGQEAAFKPVQTATKLKVTGSTSSARAISPKARGARTSCSAIRARGLQAADPGRRASDRRGDVWRHRRRVVVL